jgi:sporulation protein YlmC with PRC-barrel domain
MDISINAKVSCSDGPCGQCTRVIIKPTTEKITHLVVESDHSYPVTEYLVSIKSVVESTPDQIRLSCSNAILMKMPVFEKIQFVPANLTGYYGSPYFMMWPFYAPESTEIPLAKDHIPADELTIRRGARVEATDGHIGRVDEFLINPGNDHITHLVMREGHLWGQKDVTIPVSQIDHYKDNTVYLKLNKQVIDKLSSIPVRHSWDKKD